MSRTLSTTTLLLTAFSIWFAANPYTGIRHDALLYSLEALAILDPLAFSKDLFLAYGSQGQFTLFPQLYAALINWIGLDIAAFTITFIGKLAWLSCAAYFSRKLLPASLWPIGLAAILIYPPYYDAYHIFSYGESFATPRLYAEAASLLALGTWLSRKYSISILSIIIAVALHPLMALPILLLLGILFYLEFPHQRTRFLIIIFVGITILLGLGVAHISPADRLISSYDPEWLTAIHLRNLNVFLSEWGIEAWANIFFTGTILIFTQYTGTGTLKRIAAATFLTTIILLALSLLGSSELNNILLTQLQVWRVLWVTKIITLLILVALIPILWKKTFGSRLLVGFLVASFFTEGLSASLAVVIGIILNVIINRQSNLNFTGWLWDKLPLLIPLPFFLMQLGANSLPDSEHIVRDWLDTTSIGTILLFFMYTLSSQKNKLWTYSSVALACLTFITSIWTWNMNSNVNPNFTQEQLAILQIKIPKGSVILTPQGISQAWFVFGRAHYAGQIQTAGALFSRDTALEGIRRLRQMNIAGFPDSDMKWGEHNLIPEHDITKEAVALVCQDPILNFVILPGKHTGGDIVSFGKKGFQSIFDCKKLKAEDI
jgi:hypothetical protein